MSDLYKKLYEYRAQLRDSENKHTPTAILSDDALKALARSAPTDLDDMLKVSGIGKSFVQNYGDGFLAIILGELKPVKLTMMRGEVIETLKNLQSRLTNINRRNRMLYLPKPQPGRALDLFSGAEHTGAIIDALFSPNGKVVLCTGDSAQYSGYRRLIRAAANGARETGNNNLYVGYPFVTGRCGMSNSFNVCAPLALFPVRLDDTGGRITLAFDSSRDVIYNNALILCFNKFNGRASEKLPVCTPDDVKKREFITELIRFYAASGIAISLDRAYDGDGVRKPATKTPARTEGGGQEDETASRAKSDVHTLEKFPVYSERNFPKYGANEYELLRCAAVGLFPLYSGAVQKDFDNIIDLGTMPPSLTNLLEGADEIDDFYGESVDSVDIGVPVGSEGAIDYINELNVSQERAIERAAGETALVMQGPPGTGKSQTITSMISDAVNKGRNVLVVSQKRAALSVIYSRLGRLSRYALFVDDPKDKDAFYGRLKVMFDSADSPAPYNNVGYASAVRAIDTDTAELDEIAQKLTDDIYGVPMMDIYRENMDNPFKAGERSVSAADETALFRDCVPERLVECGYDEIKDAYSYLDDERLLERLGEYYQLGEHYPWLIDMKKNLSAADIARLMSELDKVLDLVGRRFRLGHAVKVFVKANFTAKSRELVRNFIKDPVGLYNGVKAYSEFYDSKLTADSLDFATRLYFGALYNLHKETGRKYSELNSRLMEYCGYAFIDRFEGENREIISHIATFPTIVSRICQTIDKKRELTRAKTLHTLKNAFNANISDSKRRGEMLRAIDGKRRPAVSKFVEKFAFELFRGVRVFLMTPEAVSETLPLDNCLFDLLVFDEASQIYVERGIPAIARAKKLVVCGDHKQLRPSSLGDGRIAVDEDEENEAVLEEESLLDIARFKFPEVMLSYHYRSRYGELIAFSNAAFYDGKLNIPPNPVPSDVPPIAVHKVDGRWEDRRNTAEAEKVIELISEYLTETADKPASERETLGVITFNAQQRDLILDLIDKRRETDSVFDARYAEEYARREDGEDLGLFVKNIENVQGDERDRIIFSFAYAYGDKGVISRNFGWLNRPGGENRLNVAISRAKRHIDIVTSIVPSDLKVDDIKTVGVHILRKYLEYAYCVSGGDKAGAQRVLDSFAYSEVKTSGREERETLADRVADALKDRGMAAERNVGVGNYLLDIAIRNERGKYVLGIECDDSALSDRTSTRERDVMRRKFLTDRGWTLYRVWSSEWYNDPDRVIKEISSSLRV